MADDTEFMDEETLLTKHRKEKKELQSKIQALKKTATKGDKKKKKEVMEEIAALEMELEKKQNEELDKLKGITEVNGVSTDMEKLHLDEKQPEEKVMEEEEEEEENCGGPHLQKRITKAQKRREKKATKEKERERLIAIQETENVHGARNIEMQKIKQILKEKKLMLHEIPSDGNCLYCAIDFAQAAVGGEEMGYQTLRMLTSQFLRKNCSDFLPFLSDPVTGDTFSKEQYEEYCDQIANTSSWGGQVELRALSHVLKCPIEVIQAVGPTIVIGEEYNDQKSIILTYHRHMYRLGEHYNTVKPYVDEQDEGK
ncbi:deubiquitinase OTUD6B isoform X1 [Schistocerca piceifrons]|uniref:deubiquitinase OTUD6B isoform X1 n=2 Tax=Schistocerca piceifrons TaxID=274613 RepID=UPI001F5E6AC5|nr:deubiquitinase OTUD6B isoform X1 [Schistocerca piceifrons]